MKASSVRGSGPLVEALQRQLDLRGIKAIPEAMPDKGLAHDHLRLVGTGLIARLPKQSQMKLSPADNLSYQVACFKRASLSGHAPRLHFVLRPSADLPRGGLLVEEIVGRAANVPDDLPAIMEALASIHSLPLPEAEQRLPLLSPQDPLESLLTEIVEQANYLDEAAISERTHDLILSGIIELDAFVGDELRPPRSLISFDAHPGNFVIDRTGRAVLVDLEKCRYSAPQLDIAHATLYTSTTWDVASHAVLTIEETATACQHWLTCLGSNIAQEEARGWIVPLRRAMWLWSLTWCAKWRVLSRQSTPAEATGEDWSAERSADSLITHVRRRVDHYLDPEIATMVQTEFKQLEERM